MRRNEIERALDHLRPDDRRQHATRQHQGNGAWPSLGRGDLGRGEAQMLGDSVPNPGGKRAEHIKRKIVGIDAQCERHAAADRDPPAHPEAGFAAPASEHDPRRNRSEHHADLLDRHRQRVQSRGADEFIADQRRHDGLARHHGVHQRLTGEQQPNILVHRLDVPSGGLKQAARGPDFRRTPRRVKNGSSHPSSEQGLLRSPPAP